MIAAALLLSLNASMTRTVLPPVIVISLQRSQDRRQRISERLATLGLPFRFFDAIEGKLLDAERLPAYDGRRRRLFFGRDLTASEIGCLMSHRGVCDQMIAENMPVALVLEDDAILQDDLPETLARVMDEQQKTGWDMVRFLGTEKIKRQVRPLLPLCHGYSLCRVYGTPGGAYGYLMTQSGARKIRRAMESNYVPVDVVHGQSWKTGAEVYGVVPSPILPDYDIASTMPDSRFQKTKALRGWEKIAYPFTRFGFKLYEAAGKRRDYLASWPRDRRLMR